MSLLPKLLEKISSLYFFNLLLTFYIFSDLVFMTLYGHNVIEHKVVLSEVSLFGAIAFILLYGALMLWFLPTARDLAYLVMKLLPNKSFSMEDFSSASEEGVFIQDAIDYALCNDDKILYDICRKNKAMQERLTQESNLALSLIILITIDAIYPNSLSRQIYMFAFESRQGIEGMFVQFISVVVSLTFVVSLGKIYYFSDSNYMKRIFILNKFEHRAKIDEINEWVLKKRKSNV